MNFYRQRKSTGEGPKAMTKGQNWGRKKPTKETTKLSRIIRRNVNGDTTAAIHWNWITLSEKTYKWKGRFYYVNKA